MGAGRNEVSTRREALGVCLPNSELCSDRPQLMSEAPAGRES